MGGEALAAAPGVLAASGGVLAVASEVEVAPGEALATVPGVLTAVEGVPTVAEEAKAAVGEALAVALGVPTAAKRVLAVTTRQRQRGACSSSLMLPAPFPCVDSHRHFFNSAIDTFLDRLPPLGGVSSWVLKEA